MHTRGRRGLVGISGTKKKGRGEGRLRLELTAAPSGLRPSWGRPKTRCRRRFPSSRGRRCSPNPEGGRRGRSERQRRKKGERRDTHDEERDSVLSLRSASERSSDTLGSGSGNSNGLRTTETKEVQWRVRRGNVEAEKEADLVLSLDHPSVDLRERRGLEAVL